MKHFRDQEIASVFINHDCAIDLFAVDVAGRCISFFVHDGYLLGGQPRHLGIGEFRIEEWDSVKVEEHSTHGSPAQIDLAELRLEDPDSVTIEGLQYEGDVLKLEFTHYRYLGEEVKPPNEHVYVVIRAIGPSVTARFSENSSSTFNGFLFTICQDLELPRTIEYSELLETFLTVPSKIISGEADEADYQKFEISKAICRLALEDEWHKKWQEYFELEFAMYFAEKLLQQCDSDMGA